MIDPTLAYVAVVTTAIVLPLGVHLGAARERARAELRRPLAPHEVLAQLRGPVGKGPAERNIWEVRSVEGLRRFGVQTPGPVGKGPA